MSRTISMLGTASESSRRVVTATAVAGTDGQETGTRQSLQALRRLAGAVRVNSAIRRVVCVSDIHTDYSANLKWAETVGNGGSGGEYRDGDGSSARTTDIDDAGSRGGAEVAPSETLLIVAGDVSHKLQVLRSTLRSLRSTYGEVLFVPGNHDLWLDKAGDPPEVADSVDKLGAVAAVCEEEGVCMGSVRIGGEGEAGLWIVPLLSWHHQSFDTEPDITCWGGIPSAERALSDYRRAKWPPPLSMTDESVARYMDNLNELLATPPRDDPAPTMTVSHFLPRIELTPEKRYLFLPTLNKAVGSRFVEQRLRSLGSVLHVFGHTHFGWDHAIEGVRYVQVALGYPHEREMRSPSLRISSMAEPGLEPVAVWNVGEFRNTSGGLWSDFYRSTARNPTVTHMLAPWVASRYKMLPGGEVGRFIRP